MSSPAIPQTMKAFWILGDHKAAVQEIPVPNIDDNEIVVKTVAVAQNPTDWKCAYRLRPVLASTTYTTRY